MTRPQLPPTARLHVVWRPGAPRAVVLLKRGRHFGTFGWDLVTDEVTPGQWCKNKIYMRRCDLTPDGELWGYFALNGRWDSETLGAYTVLARPPWLRAVLLWPQGNTWGGGLGFPASSPLELVTSEGRTYPINKWPIAERLLKRDGWSEVAGDGSYCKSVTSGWSLFKRHGRLENAAEQHVLEHRDGRRYSLRHWEWADVLDDGRVAWSAGAVLHALPAAELLQRLGNGEEAEQPSCVLLDARELMFKRRQAPYGERTVFVQCEDDGPYPVPDREPR